MIASILFSINILYFSVAIEFPIYNPPVLNSFGIMQFICSNFFGEIKTLGVWGEFSMCCLGEKNMFEYVFACGEYKLGNDYKR